MGATAPGTPGATATGYRYTLPSRAASDTASYRFDLPARDTYTVYGWWPKDKGYNPRVPVGVKTTAGWQWVYADQSSTGGRWVELGSFEMNAGDDWNVQVSRWTFGEGYVIADAIKVVRE